MVKQVYCLKLLPRDEFVKDRSVQLQSMGKSEFKFVPSKSKSTLKSIDQWTSAFLKYLAFYCEKFPKLVPAVIKHGEIVRQLASRRTGWCWLTFDKQVPKDMHQNFRG